MATEITANIELVSVQDTRPTEEGGPIARRGFSYQDEVAASFLIDMLKDSSIASVQCETQDDIVVVRNTPSGCAAEFVQVKTGNTAPRSVADLCKRDGGKKGTSILEKSLNHDCVDEIAWFELVTSHPVSGELQCLAYPRETRAPDAVANLLLKLEDRLPSTSSPKGNGLTYWVEHCLWDVRARTEDVRNRNLVKLQQLANDHGIALNADGIESLLDELLKRAQTAAEVKWESDPSLKTIARTILGEWWNRRILELVSISQLIANSDLGYRIAPIAAKIRASRELVDKKAFHYVSRSLRWNYIVERADSKRSLYDELWPSLLEPATVPRLFCILGEPLSGKSTLMWRVGYDLHLQSKNVLQASDLDKSLWDRLGALIEKSTEEVVLLVDDIFDERANLKSIQRFFENAASHGARVTVLATAVSDDAAKRALSDLKRESLTVIDKYLTLTDDDKKVFLEGASYDATAHGVLNTENLARIDKFHTLAATLREIDEGKLRDLTAEQFVPEALETHRLERLRDRQPRLWAAYKYVSFCHRLKITLPVPLLKRLEDFRFYDIERLEGAEAYLSFYDSFAAGRGLTTLNYRVATSQHWKLAETHWRIYTQFESAGAILRALLRAADVNDSWHGGFVTHFCRAIADDPSIPWREIFPNYLEELRKLQQDLPVEHLVIWKKLYEKLGLQEEAKRCDQATRARHPADATDAVVQTVIFETQDKDVDRAFNAIESARKRWPNNTNLEELYITFIARHRDKFSDHVRSLLEKLDVLLKDAGDRWNKVSTYIENIVIPCGEPSHHNRAANLLGSWLEAKPDHPNASALWVTYLSLVSKKQRGALPKVCAACLGWLSAHRAHMGYVHLAHAYGTLMAKLGDKQAIDDALVEITGWLADHPSDGHLWDCCLQLVGNSSANNAHVRVVIEKLMGKPDGDDSSSEHGILADIKSPNMVVSLIGVFEACYRRSDGKLDPDKLNFLFARISEWLNIYTEDHQARPRFVVFVRDFGSDAQAENVRDKTAQWLIDHPDQEVVRRAYMSLVARRLPEKKSGFPSI